CSLRECHLSISQDFDGIRCHPREGKVAKQLRRAGCNWLIERGFQNPPAHALGSIVKAKVVRAFGKVADTQPTPCAPNDSPALHWCGLPPGRFVFGHERVRPRADPKLGFGAHHGRTRSWRNTKRPGGKQHQGRARGPYGAEGGGWV